MLRDGECRVTSKRSGAERCLFREWGKEVGLSALPIQRCDQKFMTRPAGLKPNAAATEGRSLESHMGGSKPLRPTMTRVATFFPPRNCSLTITFAPGTSSDLSAAFIMTMGTPFGT
jgi:hypothetical protein